ncbi:VanW family protein [Paenibacillus mendelii]|uniref:VanW family protein n=1 Tax=Paenibacillus mendelii TaxID=206163 RepID=A0ABV6JFR4_9BACL|nr:VanW family protein [Paenibacillus mendelii]MCQ6557632.1 VanW family protein [Paenibacillus mendelii]
MKWLLLAVAIGLFPQSDVGIVDQLSIVHKGQSAGTLNRVDYEIPGSSLIDLDKFDSFVSQLDKNIHQAPRNAFIGDHGGIVPEQVGYKLNRRTFTDRFYAFYYGKGSSFIDAPLTVLYPRIDSELLANIRVKPIGQYVTYYNSRNTNRSHNISLAAKAINNLVVFPGERFSFNQSVGERTQGRGYLQAPVIVRGELSEGIGGGICQVSSTLYNATDRAGLKVIQRYSHSRNVPYVLPGRDATVSWDGPDYVFQNQYNQPVLIRASAGGGKMFVAIYSSDVIEYKPREVPGMSNQLPEEVSIEANQNRAAEHDDE